MREDSALTGVFSKILRADTLPGALGERLRYIRRVDAAVVPEK